MRNAPTERIFLSIALGCLFVLLSGGPVQAATYYVDATNGNDSYAGTSTSTAWKTLTRVMASTFSPGDSVLLKRGCVWRTRFSFPSSGAEGNPILIDAYGTGDKPLILGSERLTTWTQISGTKKWATPTMNISPNTNIGFMLLGPEVSAPVLGVNVGYVATYESELTTNGRFWWDSTNSRVVMYTDNAGGPLAEWEYIEGGVRDRALVIDGKSYVTVKNIDCRYGSGGAFRICNESHDVILDGCDASFGGGTMTNILGIRAGDLIKMDTGVYNIVIQNCTAKFSWECGISVEAWSGNNALHDIVIQNNTSYGNGSGIALGAPYYEGNLNTEVYNCWIQNNQVLNMGSGWVTPAMTSHGTGIYCFLNEQGNSSIHDSYIQDNIVDGFTSAGIYMMNGDYVVRRNIVRNGTALFSDTYWNNGILVHGGGSSESVGDSNVEISNNLVYDTVCRGLLVINNTPTSGVNVFNNTFYNCGDATTYPSVQFVSSTNTVFKNNIVHATNALYAAYFPSSGYTANRNCYYKASGNLIRWSYLTNAVDKFTTYQSYSSQDANSFVANPMLDTAAGYILKSTSPCIDKGENVGLTADYDGTAVPQGSGVDMGYQEYIATAADTTKPVITLTGTTPVTVVYGSTYTDAGATASDNIDGNITSKIVATSTVNASVLGTYAVTYNVSDTAGNAATPVVRTVVVVDTTKPVITLTGSTPVTVQVKTTYTDAGATATDNYDGTITSRITTTNNVNANVVGTYTVTYNVTDTSGNAATAVTRTVKVVDTTKPTLTLTGSSPVTVEGGATYTDAGATATDNYDGNITSRIAVTNPVNTSAVGTYTVTYNVTDYSGNAATAITRTVKVVDTTKPTLALKGSTPVSVEAGSTYTDAGATATDSYEGNISSKIVTTNPVNTATLGTYTVTYNVSDTAGNAATAVTRTVKVVDTTKPTITLKGSATVQVEVHATYTDAGATATDSREGDISSKIVMTGTVNAAKRGTYTLTYNVSDTSGNAATAVTRTVNVVDTTKPVITPR